MKKRILAGISLFCTLPWFIWAWTGLFAYNFSQDEFKLSLLICLITTILVVIELRNILRKTRIGYYYASEINIACFILGLILLFSPIIHVSGWFDFSRLIAALIVMVGGNIIALILHFLSTKKETVIY